MLRILIDQQPGAIVFKSWDVYDFYESLLKQLIHMAWYAYCYKKRLNFQCICHLNK